MGKPAMPARPEVTLPRVGEIPEESWWWPGVNARFHTGNDTVRAALDEFFSLPPQNVAMDIETQGTDRRRWQITCVTAAYRGRDGEIQSVLLDPLRNEEHYGLTKRIIDHCEKVIFHNAGFDIPIMFVHSLFDMDAHERKIHDTLLLARMRKTNIRGNRDLESLATEFNIADDSAVGINNTFEAAGYKNKSIGYRNSDIDKRFYRAGAMSDTAVTLQLWDALYECVMDYYLRAPLGGHTAESANSVIMRIQRVNQITLRLNARGLNWDPDYRRAWIGDSEQAVEEARIDLKRAGLDPGNGAQLIKRLDDRGELPGDWPRTEKGALKSDKKAMEMLANLGNPLSRAHKVVAEHAKVKNYLDTIMEAADGTGRVHPNLGILGAHASGRMSVTSPALQQFSEEARPAICSDGENWVSVDWSSIEPVVVANSAGDEDFLHDFNQGNDLYIPLGRKAGIIPSHLTDAEAKADKSRKITKTFQLAGMYGQGAASLAKQLGISVDEAKKIQGDLRRAMGQTQVFMDQVERTCENTGGYVLTLGGRVLNETQADGEVKSRVAVNHYVQGSSCDILMESVLRLDEWGYSDSIRLLIHDEMVVTEDAVEAVQAAMQTPPASLLRAASEKGMTPVLRVDANLMGTHWAYV